jgi:hypothetical protein
LGPHHLTDEQKWQRYAIADLNLEPYSDEWDAFLSHVIVLDETWARAYELALKLLSNE